jgi:cob(I)alamin adenosyltransferase
LREKSRGRIDARRQERARFAASEKPMKIYTKTGDDGTTGLFGGARVSKGDPIVEAYGTIDEVNAVIGMARATGLDPWMDDVLRRVQSDLFTIGAEVACVPGEEDKLKMTFIEDTDSVRLEKAIDEAEKDLPPLKNFVLPGGSPQAAALHFARTVTRRAERVLVRITPDERPCVVVYLNRLSDLLFVLARRANKVAGVEDIPWAPHGERK